MKFPFLLLIAVFALGAPFVASLRAQAIPASPHPAAASGDEAIEKELQAVVRRVQTRLEQGIASEAQLADELKAFDALSAKYATVKTDAAAAIPVMKALLYVEVLNSPERALPIFRKVSADFAGTETAARLALVIEDLERTVAIEAATALGRELPPFKEAAIDGTAVDLAAYRGKVVLVSFWATWCPPCLAELPQLKALHSKYRPQGFEIIGVSLDQDGGKLAEFLRRQKLEWPQILDARTRGAKLAETYGIRVTPSSFLLDRDGKIVGKNLRSFQLTEKIAELVAAKP